MWGSFFSLISVDAQSVPDDPNAMEEEEPTISVLFWSVAFVLLLIVTVWFYITQIAPAHCRDSSQPVEDKEELVAKRILEQLHVIELTSESFACEKQVECGASGGADIDTVYEYIDDEIHIHYPKSAWENDGERMNSLRSTRRRHSMDEMELIFPGILPIIIEEEEASEDSENSERQDVFIDRLHKNTSEARTLVGGETQLFSINRAPFETTGKKTAVVKPTTKQVSDAKPRVTQLDEYVPIKAVDKKWRLEPVKNQANLLCSKDDSPETKRAQEIALEENIKPAAHARTVEANPPPTIHACPFTPDVEITTSDHRNMSPQSYVKESTPVFTLADCELLPENKQTMDYNSDPVAKAVSETSASETSASETSSIKNEEDVKSVKHSGTKERQDKKNLDRKDGEPVKTLEGLTRNNTASDYACEMNGTTNEVFAEQQIDRTPTIHTWTFFSMTEASALSSLELEEFSQATGDASSGSFTKGNVPSIIIDSYDDLQNGDNGKNEPLLPATEPRYNSPYASSFETDIDVDEMDLIDSDLGEHADFDLYFKRHVSVTDLDKIISGENCTDLKNPATEEDDIILTNGSHMDDITNEFTRQDNVTKHDIAIKSDETPETYDPISTHLETVGEDAASSEAEPTRGNVSCVDSVSSEPEISREDISGVNSVSSETETSRENISCVDEAVIESTFATLESEPASSLNLYQLDQLLERNRTPSEDLDDDNLENFCEELSDLIEECKKERRPRLFTIPEEMEIAEGVFVDRSLDKGIICKPRVVMEPKSDSAPIATEEACDSDFDLDESEETAVGSPDEKFNPVESSVVENVPCIGDVIPECDEKALCQTIPLEFTENTALDYTEVRQEDQVKQTITEDASAVNGYKPDGDSSLQAEVLADVLCERNENYAVMDDCVLDSAVQAYPTYELVHTEDQKVKQTKADVFREEESQISEVPRISPTMTVVNTSSLALRHESAKRDEEEIIQEEDCRFQEEEANTTQIESGYIEVTSKGEIGFRSAQDNVIKEGVKTEAAISPCAIAAEPVNSALPLSTISVASSLSVPAQAVPVTKVTVEELQDSEGKQAEKLQSETRTQSPVDKLGLKLIVTGRRTDAPDEMKKETSQVLKSGNIPSEDHVSPDSGRSSPMRYPRPAERPRRTFKSTHQIRLTKSQEDLRVVASYPRDEPRRVVVKEHLVPEEVACVHSTPSVPSPPPVVPLDGAIDSVQHPRIHKAKITVSETVGNRTRVTILNVRKRVPGNARWKSLNDLDSFGAPMPVTNEASRMSWSGDEIYPEGTEMAGGRLDNHQRVGRVESGYGSLDFLRKTPSPPTEVSRGADDYTPRTQPKETIFAVSAEPVVRTRIADIEEETEDSSTDLGDEMLGESRVMVTDLDSVLLSLQGLTPKVAEVGLGETSTQKAKGDHVEETVIKIQGYEGPSRDLVAYSVAEEAVPLEAVVLPQNPDSAQENAPIITAFPVNDGYEDEELDDVFYEDIAPIRNSGSGVAMRFSNNMPDVHSSDADSETSSVQSVILKQHHLQTRAALEASSTRVARFSDSTDSSHTATSITELESDPFDTFAQSSNPNENSRVRHSRSTTEIDTESSQAAVSAFSRVGSSSLSGDTSRTRPRSQLCVEKAASDEEAKKSSKASSASFHESDIFTGRDNEKQLFRDKADSRKSMPDLSSKSEAVNDSPYLRGLSAHTKRWLSQNFMSPATFSDKDGTLGSEMFLHPTSFINLADDGDSASIASVSTRPQSPMSEFSFAGEVPYACQQRGSRTVVKCAYARCGREEVLFGKQKTTYTSCPACFTYYCNRDCRRVHWAEHKKVCFFGRINSYVRSFVYHTGKRENLKFLLSKVANEGYKKNGRGCVMVTFASPQSARKFMTTGCVFFPSPPSYSSLPELKAEGVISKHKEVMLQLMKDYDPAQEFILNLAIIAGKMGNLPPEPVPRRKVNTVLQCVKIPLSDRLVDSSLRGGLDSSPETKVFYLPKCSRHEFVSKVEARRHYCRNISKELKQYGIKLKKDYPVVYDKLCKYVEKNLHFEPQSVQGNRAGRVVTCKIMPEL